MLKVFVTLLICSATMSAVALFYMAITPLLAKRYSAKWRYYAWLVIVIGLLIPFRPHFETAIITVNVPTETIPITQVWNGTPNNAMPNEDVTPSVPASPSISWEQLAMAIWLAGVISVLSYHAIRHYRFLKMVKRWSQEVTDTRTLGIIHELTEQVGMSCAVKVQECSCIPAPMMINFFTPTILLPKTNFSDDDLSFILKHELVHFKRKDLWYKSLVLVTTAIHWFNPVVYLISKEVAVQCELSCDEEVLRSEDADMRQQYCETIIGVIRNQCKVKTALSTNFYGGKKGMKKRIFSIMDTTKRKTGVAVICAVLIVTMGTGMAFAASPYSLDNNLPTGSSIMDTANIGSTQYHLVETEEQLRAIGSEMYPLSGNYMLNADITLTQEWIPIGGIDKPFTGTFTGNGFEIVNLTITDPSVNLIGMFGHAQNAKIYNVTLRNIDIESAFRRGDTIAPIVAWGIDCDIYDNQIID